MAAVSSSFIATKRFLHVTLSTISRYLLKLARSQEYNNLTWSPKAGRVKSEETSIARQLLGKNVSATMPNNGTAAEIWCFLRGRSEGIQRASQAARTRIGRVSGVGSWQMIEKKWQRVSWVSRRQPARIWAREQRSWTEEPKSTASIVKEACLLIRCLAMNILFLLAWDRVGMCLPSRYLAMGIHVTILLHVHPLLGNVLLNKFPRRYILGKQSVARLRNNRGSCVFCVRDDVTTVDSDHVTCFLYIRPTRQWAGWRAVTRYVFTTGPCPSLGYISIKQLQVTNNSGRSTRTSKQGDSHGKFVVEEELEVGLWSRNV
jgi:hypothetical protein